MYIKFQCAEKYGKSVFEDIISLSIIIVSVFDLKDMKLLSPFLRTLSVKHLRVQIWLQKFNIIFIKRQLTTYLIVYYC